MELLGFLAAVLLSLVAYSAGATSVLRWRYRVPGLADLSLAVACAAAAVAARGALGHWLGLATGVAGSGLVGLLASAVVSSGDGSVAERHGREAAEDRPEGRWKRFALALGNYQGRLFMGLLYFVLLAPVGAVARLLSDPLGLKRRGDGSWWHDREGPAEGDPDDLRSQA